MSDTERCDPKDLYENRREGETRTSKKSYPSGYVSTKREGTYLRARHVPTYSSPVVHFQVC